MAYTDVAPVGAALVPLEIPARQSRRLLLCGLLFVFVFAGLFGRDPWKPDEAYTMGIVHHIVQTGEWVEHAPYFDAVAVTGEGVFDTLKAVSKLGRASCRERV